MGSGAQAASETGKLRLFISYSRADLAFADELTAGLEYDGAFEVAIDRHSIIEGEDWRKRLGALIADADTIVFLLSPASAKSDICAWEVDEAVRLTKRIVPVLVAPLGAQPAPAALAALNYVRFDPLDDGRPRSFMAGLTGLVRALKSDLGWLREHTRLLARASEWAEAGRASNRLLTGEAVAEAKAWAARRPKDAPALNALHLEFIAASEQAETLRQSEAAQALAERERLLAQAEQAAKEREAAATQMEAAVAKERAALRRSARMQRVATGLLVVASALLVGIIFKAEIEQFVFDQTTVRNFIAAKVRPAVLSAAAESALKPGATFRECAAEVHCPEMVVVPAGEFMMGSPEGQGRDHEHPQHLVKIARPFAVAKYDITWDDWEQCVAMRGCDGRPTGDSGYGRGNKPLINVSWDQAVAYALWLAKMTGKPYRLLSEAEWEYAARAGTTTAYWFGDDAKDICNYANGADQSFKRGGGTGDVADCDDKFVVTSPVGSFPPNKFGLHDMSGNVQQWVADPYHETYEGAPADGSVWEKDGDAGRRVVRGGSWLSDPRTLRSAFRFGNTTDFRISYIGIRVGRTLGP